jgi:hypothetical protein
MWAPPSPAKGGRRRSTQRAHHVLPCICCFQLFPPSPGKHQATKQTVFGRHSTRIPSCASAPLPRILTGEQKMRSASSLSIIPKSGLPLFGTNDAISKTTKNDTSHGPRIPALDDHSISDIELRRDRARAEPLGRADIQRKQRPSSRPRPVVALVRSPADIFCDGAVPASPASSRTQRLNWRLLLEACLFAFLCGCAALILVSSYHDDSSCGPKLYRDPVTGRMATIGEARPNGKAPVACARRVYPEEGRAPQLQ